MIERARSRAKATARAYPLLAFADGKIHVIMNHKTEIEVYSWAWGNPGPDV